MDITNEIKNQMAEIIKNKEIKSVFQPIVSLKTGTIYGYEALSRITLKKCSFNIGEAFEIAEDLNCLWALEKLCRVNSIKMSSNKPKTAKLFLNADPNIIRDPEFKSGVTHEKLAKYNLDCSDIVFEATERSAIKDIDKDEMKRSFVSALSQFAKDSGISLIAEGIETSAQLETVISLKIDYAQGFYLAKPSEKFQKLNLEIKKEILRLNNTLFYVQTYFINCIVLTILLRKHIGL